ncbi:MAG: TraV family lipoprotein [Gallionella sp.]|nr:TraV family lipoprotein [Gallionella sp.]
MALTLTGCGAALNPYNESFRCQAPEDSGQCVDTKTAYEEATGFGKKSDGKPLKAEESAEAARLTRLAELLHEPQTPMIAPPRVLRVLILPYKGSGDLFMARYAYLQVEPANWVLTGVDEGLE